MVLDCHEIISILAIGFIWGVTNPFLRKGNLEIEGESTTNSTDNNSDNDDEEEIECQEKEILVQRDEEDEKLSLASSDENSGTSEFVSYGSIEPTGRNNVENRGQNSLYSNSSSCSSCETFEQVQLIEATTTATSNTSINQPTIKPSFVHSVIQTLITFKSPRVAIPFLMNQTSALFYYKLVATSDLTSAAYCNALAMVFSAYIGYLLGERMDKPIRALIGSILVTIGVAMCMVSDDLESFILKRLGSLQGNVIFDPTRGDVGKGLKTMSLSYLVNL